MAIRFLAALLSVTAGFEEKEVHGTDCFLRLVGTSEPHLSLSWNFDFEQIPFPLKVKKNEKTYINFN